jgi:hypothetical protein
MILWGGGKYEAPAPLSAPLLLDTEVYTSDSTFYLVIDRLQKKDTLTLSHPQVTLFEEINIGSLVGFPRLEFEVPSLELRFILDFGLAVCSCPTGIKL